MTENTEDWSKRNFKEPRSLLPELTRLIQKKDTEVSNPRSLCNAVILQLGRSNAFYCPEQRCRRTRICQRPAYKCHSAHLADLYDWDYGLPASPRAPMYEEIIRRMKAGEYTPGNFANELEEVVLSFEPELKNKIRRYDPPDKAKRKG